MNKRAFLTLACFGALLSLPSRSPAQAPAAPGEAKSFELDPPGAEKSSAPSAEEWKTAPPVKLTREVSTCRSYRLREWLKLYCDNFPAAGVSLLAGQVEGVMVFVEQDSAGGNEAMKKNRSASVVFPVRRGDGRMLQIAQFGEGYDGPIGWNAAVTVSEQWASGEAAPIIAVW
jgi:hypothetical protein